jgi:hypothetical protein
MPWRLWWLAVTRMAWVRSGLRVIDATSGPISKRPPTACGQDFKSRLQEAVQGKFREVRHRWWKSKARITTKPFRGHDRGDLETRGTGKSKKLADRMRPARPGPRQRLARRTAACKQPPQAFFVVPVFLPHAGCPTVWPFVTSTAPPARTTAASVSAIRRTIREFLAHRKSGAPPRSRFTAAIFRPGP